jgi:hypothetical protein
VADATQSSGEAGASFAFDAFISYRRSDGTKAARRLRQKLQRYDIRKRLKKMKRKKLNVFLDTVYERGAHDFYERNIQPALLSARRLIVLATPDAVLRPSADDWIQREISDFRAHRGAENILVVRAAGDFLAELPGDLSTTAPNIQIIDLRHDGFWSALSPLRSARVVDEWIKLAAPLFDVPTQDMPRLRREQERAQQRALAVAAGAITGAVAFAAALSWYALTQQRASQRTLENSLFAASRVIQTASGLSLPSENEGEKRAMLMTACDLFDNLANEDARAQFELEVLNCDIDRVSALIDSNEPDRAGAYLRDIEPRVRARYAEKKDAAWAGAVSSMLDLSIRLAFLSPPASDADQTKAILENTREQADLFRAHPTLYLADGYSNRVSLLVERLESAEDFKGSADATETAATLFEAMGRKDGDPGSETDDTAEERRNFGFREAALLHRRLGWIRTEKLNDNEGGLKATAAAMAVTQAGLALTKQGNEQYIALRREEMLAEAVRGTALLRLQRLKEGLEADSRSVAVADDLLALDVDGALRQQIEDERTSLEQRIAGVTAALAAEQP